MRHITSEEGFELLEQLRILGVDGYKLERPRTGSGLHDSSVVVYRYNEMIGECDSFSDAISYANGYEKARRKHEWELPPIVSGVRRSFIAVHNTENGFRTENEVVDWINRQTTPESYHIGIMEVKA